MNIGKMELMAPAGGFDCLQAAIDNGADSVYFGVDQLNMRARATMNFTLDDLKEIAQRCKAKQVKTYLTLNTIVYDHDLSIIKTIVDRVKETGIDAVIASDQAVIHYAKSQGVSVHISTQLNITNIETVKFYSLFADVMVLSRELSLRQVKEITQIIKKENICGPNGKQVKIEIFGHGALCMAVSGKCYLSLHTQNSSANRGACVQNCRRKYKVIDLEDGHELEIDNEYIMSPEDLCTIDILDQVKNAGVDVLKIEGRARAPEYVAMVCKIYREAIDSLYTETYSLEKAKAWMDQLSKVYNRGFWNGYYMGQELGSWTNNSGSSATEKKVFLGKGLHYFPKAKIGHFKIESHSLKPGDTILVTGPKLGAHKMTAGEIRVNNIKVEIAEKGQECTFSIDKTIRPSDKLYKIVAS